MHRPARIYITNQVIKPTCKKKKRYCNNRQYAVSIIIIASQDSKTTLNYGWLCFKNYLLNQFTSYLIVRLMSSSPIKKKITHKHTKPKHCYKIRKKKITDTHTYALDAVVQRMWDNYLSILSSKDRAISRSIIPNLFWRLMESRGRKWGNEDKERHHREYGNWIRTEGEYNRGFASTLKRN